MTKEEALLAAEILRLVANAAGRGNFGGMFSSLCNKADDLRRDAAAGLFDSVPVCDSKE